MPRNGMNPNRQAVFAGRLPPNIPAVVVITHLPADDGYHKDRFEIVRASLETARKFAGCEHQFIVWDNGSNDILQDWMFYEFKPDLLIFSENIGKQNTMHRLFQMFTGGILTIADDDILYYPDWLTEQGRILKQFPNVGIVSGCVASLYSGNAVLSVRQWAKANSGKVEVWKEEIPQLWDAQHGMSVGRSYQDAINAAQRVNPMAIKYNGLTARIGGAHCQYVCYPERIAEFAPQTKRLMEPLYPFDQRIDQAGLLRLFTYERTSRHLGNVLTGDDREEIERMLDERNEGVVDTPQA